MLDHDPEERAKQEGVFPGFAWLPWKDKVLFLADTPGGEAFQWPSRLAAQGADLRVVVVSARGGVEPGTERILRQIRQDEAPAILVVTGIDEISDDREVAAVADAGRTAAMVLDRTMIRLGCRGPHGWTHALDDQAPPERRRALGEDIALTDDALLEAWVEAGRLEDDAARDGLARAVARAATLPVLACSGRTGEGVRAVMDALAALAPPPSGSEEEPLRLLRVGTWLDGDDPVGVFRVQTGSVRLGQTLRRPADGTEHRVGRWYAIRGPRRAKARIVGPGALVATWEPLPCAVGEVLTDARAPVEVRSHVRAPPRMAWSHLRAEPPVMAEVRKRLDLLQALDGSLRVDEEAQGYRLSAINPEAVDRAVWRLRERWGLPVRCGPPPVPYLERPARRAEGARGVHRIVGGDDLVAYAEVALDVTPADPEAAFVCEVLCDEDDLPARWHDCVQQGAEQALGRGPLAGYPVFGVAATCPQAAYDMFVTEGEHVVKAAAAAMSAGLQEAGTELWEPWSEVSVHVPLEHVGAVVSEIAAVRGQVVGMEMGQGETVILAGCPERTLGALAHRLRDLTRGLGWFSSRRSAYRPLPPALWQEVVQQSPYDAQESVRARDPEGLGLRAAR